MAGAGLIFEVVRLNGMQTTLQARKIPEIDEFKKNHLSPLQYVLEKYRQWKELKEKESNAVQKPAAL